MTIHIILLPGDLLTDTWLLLVVDMVIVSQQHRK